MAAVRGKDGSIESLRGIAIILVVGLHITNDGALESARNFYEYLGYSFQNIRIPLFTVISGYLYGLRPVYGGNLGKFLSGKSRRILIPLFFVATSEYLAKSLLPGVNNPQPIGEFWKASLYPYEHFWFLQVIFLIFVIYGFLGWVKVLPSLKNWLILLFFSAFLYIVYPSLNIYISVFSVGAISYLLPFFTLGYGIANYEKLLINNRAIWFWVLTFFLVFGYQQLLWFSGDHELASKRTLVGLLVSVSSGCVLFYFRKNIKILAFVGSYAYTIYLYQGFGTSIGRRLGFEDLGPHFYFIAIIGFTVVFGILIENLARIVPYLSTPAIGLSYKRSK